MILTALDRLGADGLVDLDHEEIVDSRLHRYYRLTAPGIERLAEETARLRANAHVAMTRLVLAWANDRGHRWGRFGAVALLALALVSPLAGIRRHSAASAVADLVVGIALCATAPVATALIISIDSNMHYDKPRPDGGGGSPGTDRPTSLIRTDRASWN
jgi:hypothetical protein